MSTARMSGLVVACAIAAAIGCGKSGADIVKGTYLCEGDHGKAEMHIDGNTAHMKFGDKTRTHTFEFKKVDGDKVFLHDKDDKGKESDMLFEKSGSSLNVYVLQGVNWDKPGEAGKKSVLSCKTK